MDTNWKKTLVGNEIKLLYGKSYPLYKRIKGKYPVFGSNGIIDYSNKYLIKGPGIIIGRKGSVGEIHYSENNYWPIDTTYFVETSNYNFLKFWFYLLKYKDLTKMNTHSAVPGLNREIVNQLKCVIPTFNEQKKIAEFLSLFDKKIELNKKINSILEQISQDIFKYWFVDFEFPNEHGMPYKSSGGRFIDSELGKIPEDWMVRTLENYINLVDNRGKTPPLANRITPYPIIDVKALSGKSRIINYKNCTKYVEERTYSSWFRSGHPRERDILLSTVGSLGEIKLFFSKKGCIAQNVIGFRSKRISPLYLYQYLKYIKNNLISYDIGTVQPSIKVTHIIKHKILIPNRQTLKSFDKIIGEISNMIFMNSKGIQTLSQIRDTLLPKLITGKIRLNLKKY